MKVKAGSTINAAIAGVTFVNVLLVPGLWVRLFGETADLQGLLFFQLILFLFAGLAMVCWTGLAAPTSALGRGIRHSLIAANGLAVAVASAGAMYGVYNQFAWGPVAMLSILALGFVFIRPNVAMPKKATVGSPVTTQLVLPRGTFQD